MIRSWSCEAPAYHHAYNTASNTLISTHQGFIVAWNPESGTRLSTGEDGSGCIYCVDSHSSQNVVISGNSELKVVEWRIVGQVLEVVREFELPCLSGWAYGGVWSVKYSEDSELIYCTEPQSQSIKIYNKQSEKVGELKGHSDCVNSISTIPGEIFSYLVNPRRDSNLYHIFVSVYDSCNPCISERFKSRSRYNK
jgi:WD40 repeat protein